jgi:Flp pilus assembly protein TadD
MQISLTLAAMIASGAMSMPAAQPSEELTLFLEPSTPIEIRKSLQSRLERRAAGVRFVQSAEEAAYSLRGSISSLEGPAMPPPERAGGRNVIVPRPQARIGVVAELERNGEILGPFTARGDRVHAVGVVAGAIADAIEAYALAERSGADGSTILGVDADTAMIRASGPYEEGVVAAVFAAASVAATKGELKEAEMLFELFVKLRPLNEFGHYNLGVVLLNQERWGEAEAALEVATRINPTNDIAHFNRGVALLNEGRRREARRVLLRVLELNPHYPNARELLARTRR